MNGSGAYLVRAYRSDGQAPPGFPKFSHGWVLASPAVGDLDGDGDVDEADRDRLLGAFGRGAGHPAFLAGADYDEDGVVTFADYQSWLAQHRAFQAARSSCGLLGAEALIVPPRWTCASRPTRARSRPAAPSRSSCAPASTCPCSASGWTSPSFAPGSVRVVPEPGTGLLLAAGLAALARRSTRQIPLQIS